MNIIAKDYVGTFTLGNTVDITDPCYDKGTWCRVNVACQPGEYTGYAEISDEGEWGKRVANIAIYKDDKYVPLDEMECINTIGVDAGLAGFFNNKPDYEDWMGFLVESGVFKTKEEYNYEKDYYAVDYGVFSESGYGDGSYDVYATPERDAFMIVFINEYEDDYEDE